MRKRNGLRVCIYCMKERDRSAFKGREHVLHRAFGRFKNSPTLDCVCDKCNGYFGETMDLNYARDEDGEVVVSLVPQVPHLATL